ncbi:MAG: hypothetical protein K8W52_47405 [Deltaproteobacteria bacterium]|nr:hypothetical protein [Deltaproteobacteria bacterium]
MKKLGAIALTFGMILGACGGGAGKVGEMRDKMCACKDADCAGKVMEEMSKLGDSFGKDYKPSEAEAKAAGEMAECMQKLMK